jgi:ATP-dependent Lon protease
MVLPFTITDEKSIKLIEDAISQERHLAYFLIKESSSNIVRPYDLYEYGTEAEVLKMARLPEGSLRILVQGLQRIKLKKIVQRHPYLVAEVEATPESPGDVSTTQSLFKSVSASFLEMIKLAPYIPEELQVIAMNLNDPIRLAYLVASNLNIPPGEKQRLIEANSTQERLERLHILLSRELEFLKIGKKIQTEVQDEIERFQREHYLREQLKAIQRELGEVDERTAEVAELRSKIERARMPADVQEVSLKEVDRLSRIMPATPEYTVARTYIDWLVCLPWSVSTQDRLDLRYAKRILDEDHYDLEKVKQRILEYLAVRKLTYKMKGPILCFLGPPGVGKTSVGMSIAKAMGRKFVRLSLGGIRDEAEIRGHRRTYVGALPGRIIQSMKKAGTNNPLFMLDEIDKLGIDFRGDPAAALLEVLDPEQNHTFEDHYLDVPFDLSKVLFITTANILDPIPPALLDRMEVLELPGYTEEEKLHIAREYIIPKQLKLHGLSAQQLRLSDTTIRRVISSYTQEAGLRNLEREIATICRKVAKDIATGRRKGCVIKTRDLSRLLGPERYILDVAERTQEIGVAIGLAWTGTGGDILFIEATRMPGSKGLTLTGQLGDVMKESAQAALSYIRTRAAQYKIDKQFFNDSDIHIHIPSGAIPKDGPSAGITIAAALYSLLTERSVTPFVAMTGEITLRGKVLPVGGIKEKILAAKRAGIKKIIIPSRNKKDLQELPKDVRKKLSFVFVNTIDQMIRTAFRS